MKHVSHLLEYFFQKKNWIFFKKGPQKLKIIFFEKKYSIWNEFEKTHVKHVPHPLDGFSKDSKFF